MSHDDFWRRAHRNLYDRRGLEDRDFAAVPELRDDGAAVLVKLTIDRVEAYALDYSERGCSESFSFPSDE